MAPRGDTRAKMLRSAVALMQRNGAAAVTVDAVLAHSGAPRGSVYHHFPGGRDQIVHEGLASAGDWMTAMIRSTTEQSVRDAVATFVDFWRHLLTSSDFTAGCPVAGAAVGGSESDPELHGQVAEIFAGWHTILTDHFIAAGVEATRARSVTTMLVAATEGALILARIERSVTPIDDVADEIGRLVDGVLPEA